MKKILNIFLAITVIAVFSTSCVKDLDTKPIDPDEITAADVFDNPDSYIQILAKLYAGLAVSGQQGPSGQPDITGIDEGFGQYLRGLWYHQVLTTEEAVIGWNDQTIKNFHGQSWGASDVFITAFYYRIFYQIAATNEYIRETTEQDLDDRGVTGDLRDQIHFYRAEARFLRALSYYHALDMFANVPFVTENDPVGAFIPPQIMRANLFNYVESELLEIQNEMVPPKMNVYGRADQVSAWMLLAKLYLNAKVYTGIEMNDKALEYSEKVINSGYSLDPVYANIFLADNNNSPEIIFPIAFDGINTQTWGGTTFIIHAAVGGDAMVPADYGLDGGWGGTRTTSTFVRKFFPDIVEGTWSSPFPSRGLNEYPLLYVPGSYQGWDPSNTTTVLGSVNSDGNYEGYLNFPDANTEFKFTPQPNWDYDWGGDGAGNLVVGGPNIVAAEAGYYKINVDTNALTYTVEKTDWGVIGSATAGGWDSDQNMTYNAESGLWVAVLDLTEGAIKFRANDDWALNYGDGETAGILVEGGADIPIPSAGTYEISMKLGAPDYTYSIVQTSVPSYDHRAMFFTEGQSLEIEDIGSFNDGYAITKFKNITSTGATGSDLTFPDTDFPLFRLADAYLMYAEAVKRGGGGSESQAVDYVNALRERAYGNSDGNITASELTLDFILDERARELYWEAQRRTDLIRFGKFTGGSYVWPWKGNSAAGAATDSKYNVFPIPDSDLNANSNLEQNPGY